MIAEPELRDLADKRAGVRSKLEAEYRQLIRRRADNAAQAGDRDRLDEVMDKLGVSLEEAAADVQTLRKAAELRAAIVPAETIEQLRAEQAETAAAALATVRAQLKERIDFLTPKQIIERGDGAIVWLMRMTVWREHVEVTKAFDAGFFHSEMQLRNKLDTNKNTAAELDRLERSNTRLFSKVQA